MQIKKIGREAMILEEKSQKCNWYRYFCKIFLLIQIVGELVHLWSFDVLLTVHFNIFILVINQLDAQSFILQ